MTYARIVKLVGDCRIRYDTVPLYDQLYASNKTNHTLSGPEQFARKQYLVLRATISLPVSRPKTQISNFQQICTLQKSKQ